MNPGPFGMAQTGVPFGEIGFVRDWLGIEAPVGEPAAPASEASGQGFACRRSEVSGARLWGAVARALRAARSASSRATTSRTTARSLFLEASGRNRTPDQLPAARAGARCSQPATATSHALVERSRRSG